MQRTKIFRAIFVNKLLITRRLTSKITRGDWCVGCDGCHLEQGTINTSINCGFEWCFLLFACFCRISFPPSSHPYSSEVTVCLMKSYNTCDDPKNPTKIRIEQEPAKSLLTGLRKISPSASAAFLVGVLEAVWINELMQYTLRVLLYIIVDKRTPSTSIMHLKCAHNDSPRHVATSIRTSNTFILIFKIFHSLSKFHLHYITTPIRTSNTLILILKSNTLHPKFHLHHMALHNTT